MKKYNLMNNIFGWFSFAVAAVVYLMTIEPTASFWDCGEFITSAYKLEIGHPPGAPFFMLTGKFFTLFASNVEDVARMVNSMSALLSAATILFLFWTITHLARKLVYQDTSKEMTLGQMIVILGSGLIGALTYTFTDTFWFSAVEGEVYAYSSMFTALVFWLILKWENRADRPGSDKWLVLIAYAMGLSIGVHLLNLLCIPAIVLVYYFKKSKEITLKGTLFALAGSLGLIVILMYGVIPGFVKVGGWFELAFVNDMGFSYNTGSLVYILLLIVSIVWGLFETLSKKGSMNRAKIAFIACLALSGILFIGSSWFIWLALALALIVYFFKNKNVYIAALVVYGIAVIVYTFGAGEPIRLLFLAYMFVLHLCYSKSKDISFRMLNTSILCLMVILIGYSSFALIPIRSIANTPMDQNSPENVFTLSNYLNREQYGDNPLFYGRTYASTEARDASRKAIISSEKVNYDKVVKKSPDEKDRYVEVGTTPTYEYTNTMLFPRMYSNEDRHILGYQIWGGIKNPSVKPTFFENLQYFFSYQVNFMYIRYFMWNFSGRQNDIQGVGALNNGNWVTGIGFIDEYILDRGPQDELPPDIADNKGHNVYYGIPFILGLLGIAFQITRGKKGEQQFLVTFMLFFMTGLAIIVYLNQKPFEPRERDYAYAGSFYAYCIWIGFGVAAIWNLLRKKLPEMPAAVIATVATLFVPIQMASQNWDDHDRSDRYTMRDFGRNYLDSCEPEAILFTNGDNDTFPLWYVQEVEGYRTDVRVCNLSYLQTDWYVDQMRRQAYDSKPLPIEWEADRYQGSKGQAAYVLTRKAMNKDITESLQQQTDGRSWAGQIDFSEYYDVTAFKDTMALGDVLNILKTQDKYTPKNPYRIESGVIIPSSIYSMPIDTAQVDWNRLDAQPTSQFTINVGDNKGGIYRQEIMIMEMLYNINKDNWKRPIYYATTIGDFPLNLAPQLMLEGISYRITPGIVDGSRVNTEVAFENMVNKFKWGGIENPKVYLDENNLRMCRTFRMMFANLISALIEKGENEKALIALDRCMEAIPGNTVPRGGESLIFVDAYYEVGQPEKAQKIMDEILTRADRTLMWYAHMNSNNMRSCSLDVRENLDTQIRALDIYQRYDQAKYDALKTKVFASTEMFLSNGISFSDRSHPLDLLWTISMRGYAGSEDSTTKQVEGEAWQRTMGLMQKYAPQLLQKYQRQ